MFLALFQAKKELLEAVTATKESLLHVKRDRLLHEAGEMEETAAMAELEPDLARSRMGDSGRGVPGREREGTSSSSPWKVGDRCKFRHRDGRVHVGEILEWSEDYLERSCVVGFVHPWDESAKVGPQ